MKNWMFVLLISFGYLFLQGCTPAEAEGPGSYEETKKMLVDLLKSDEGKKAIKEVLTDEKVKQEIIMDQAFVKKTIEETLTSKKGKKFWKELMKDPKTAEALAKSMKKQNEELLKSLMKDPEYRKMMIEIMKDPALEKEIMGLLTSQKFREQQKKVMMETFESPLVKAQIAEMVKKSVEEAIKSGDALKKEEGKKDDKGGGGGQNQGQQ
ncbi:spore germination lipoprotein GerD [Alkalihalobacillus sp. AL-G]|uniref:spore germination lipoprotein GerD n=1 Tax=Alkalihalobacillus sp. AL-G TaxID=2926399 RepID=UPI00272D9C6E|nr:spore germination lipoprotein GerD [Alkalihalobacillus sp. AL-G]WLD93566.1 spore germination lipoprotein GerD [Alkalihalobacillus sp. AL-G]